MFNFFRKIRIKLADANKPIRYFRYAIGEIVLVVIGILIALQVNTWNENRKFKNEGAQVLNELNDEFMENRKILKQRIHTLENANHSIRKLLSYINMDKQMVQMINLDSLINSTLYYGNYNPDNSTILEMIEAGKLKLITHKSLKKNLYQWLQLLKDTDEDFKNQDQQATTLLDPFLVTHISIANLNLHKKNIGVDKKSQLFSGDYDAVLHNLEFENLYHLKLFWNTILLDHYKELDLLALEIITQSLASN